MKLLLFDIDGTLPTFNGIDKTTVGEALADAFGRPLSFDDISFSDKTIHTSSESSSCWIMSVAANSTAPLRKL